MNTNIEVRVSSLENMAAKLAKSNALTNEVLNELTSEISTEIRSQVKEEVATRSKEIEGNILATVGDQIRTTVRKAVNERGLNRDEMKLLEKARQKRWRELLGDSKTDEYKIFISLYQGLMSKQYRKKFNVSAYGDVEATLFKEALSFIQTFEITPGYRAWCVDTLHKTYIADEFPNKKTLHAYERYFGIA